MGTLPSREMQDGILDSLLDRNQENTGRENRRRVVLIPLTKRFMCRIPAESASRQSSSATSPQKATATGTSLAAANAGAAATGNGTVGSGLSKDGNSIPSATVTTLSTSAGGGGLTDTQSHPSGGALGKTGSSERHRKSNGGGGVSRNAGMSPPAVENHFAPPAEYPLVQQLFDAYCEPNVQFFCRKNGWGPSLCEMPDRMYYPTLDAFYAATVNFYESQLVDSNRKLQERFDAFRVSEYKRKNLDKGPGSTATAADASTAKPKAAAATTMTPSLTVRAPPRLVPTPCAICFHYPTNRLATAENPYDPTVYTYKSRNNTTAATTIAGNANATHNGTMNSNNHNNTISSNGSGGGGGARGDSSTASGGSEDSGGRRSRKRFLAPAESVVIGPKSSLMAVGFVGLVPTRLTRSGVASASASTAASPTAQGKDGSASTRTTLGLNPSTVRGGPVPFVKPPAENDPSAPQAASNGKSSNHHHGSSDKATRQRQDTEAEEEEEEYELVIFLSKSGGSFFMTRALFMAVALYVRQCRALAMTPLPLPPIRYTALLTDLVHQSFLREIRLRVAQASTARSAAGRRHGHERLLYTLRQRVRLSGHLMSGRLSSTMADQFFSVIGEWWQGIEHSEEQEHQEEINAVLAKMGCAAPGSPAAADRKGGGKRKKNKKGKPTEAMTHLLAPSRYLFYGFVEDPFPPGAAPTPSKAARPLPPQKRVSANGVSAASTSAASLPLKGGTFILDAIRAQLAFAEKEEGTTSVRRKAAPTESAAAVGKAPSPANTKAVVTGDHQREKLPEQEEDGVAKVQGELMDASPPSIAIYAIVGRNGLRKPLDVLKQEEQRRQEDQFLHSSDEDDDGDDEESWLDDDDGDVGGAAAHGVSGSMAQKLVWPEGTVLRQSVDRRTGEFLQPCWEVAMENEEHILGFMSYPTQASRRALRNAPSGAQRDEVAGTPASSDGTSADSASAKRKARRRRKKNTNNSSDLREGADGADGEPADTSTGSDEGRHSNHADSTRGSTSSGGSGGSSNSNSRRLRKLPIIPRRLRLVPPYDVVLSWIKDHYVFARGAAEKDARWRRSFKEDHFAAMARQAARWMGGSSSLSTRSSELTKENLATLGALSSLGKDKSPFAGDGNSNHKGTVAANAAAHVAGTAGTYLWEFEHQGRTYSIALTPNFARETASAANGLGPAEVSATAAPAALGTGKSSKAKQETGDDNGIQGKQDTAPSATDSTDNSADSAGSTNTANASKKLKNKVGVHNGSEGRRSKQRNRMSSGASVATTTTTTTSTSGEGASNQSNHARGISDAEVHSDFSRRTDPNSDDMSYDSNSKSSHSTLSTFYLQSPAERRRWKQQTKAAALARRAQREQQALAPVRESVSAATLSETGNSNETSADEALPTRQVASRAAQVAAQRTDLLQSQPHAPTPPTVSSANAFSRRPEAIATRPAGTSVAPAATGVVHPLATPHSLAAKDAAVVAAAMRSVPYSTGGPSLNSRNGAAPVNSAPPRPRGPIKLSWQAPTPSSTGPNPPQGTAKRTSDKDPAASPRDVEEPFSATPFLSSTSMAAQSYSLFDDSPYAYGSHANGSRAAPQPSAAAAAHRSSPSPTRTQPAPPTRRATAQSAQPVRPPSFGAYLGNDGSSAYTLGFASNLDNPSFFLSEMGSNLSRPVQDYQSFDPDFYMDATRSINRLDAARRGSAMLNDTWDGAYGDNDLYGSGLNGYGSEDGREDDDDGGYDLHFSSNSIRGAPRGNRRSSTLHATTRNGSAQHQTPLGDYPSLASSAFKYDLTSPRGSHVLQQRQQPPASHPSPPTQTRGKPQDRNGYDNASLLNTPGPSTGAETQRRLSHVPNTTREAPNHGVLPTLTSPSTGRPSQPSRPAQATAQQPASVRAQATSVPVIKPAEGGGVKKFTISAAGAKSYKWDWRAGQ